MEASAHYQFIVPHTVQNSESYSAFYFAEKYDIVRYNKNNNAKRG